MPNHELPLEVREATQAVLLDGPWVGWLRDPGRHVPYYQTVRLPRPLPPTLRLDDEIRPTGFDSVVYEIGRVEYPVDHAMFVVPIGWSESRPTFTQIVEHVPTGLAEQGLIPWELVPETRRDLDTPIGIEMVGDPVKLCRLTLPGLEYYWASYLVASCECGWSTVPVELDRRSQLLRVAHRHRLGELARRARYTSPIAVYNSHLPVGPDCWAGFSFVKDWSPDGLGEQTESRMYGSCSKCSWRTEPVERWRAQPLGEVCASHRGIDAERRMRAALDPSARGATEKKEPE